MRVSCAAIIENPNELVRFVKKIKNLGFRPMIIGNTVYVDYIGYNKVKHDLLVEVFKDRAQHNISTDT